MQCLPAIRWVQWGRRNDFRGVTALSNAATIEVDCAYHSRSRVALPTEFKVNLYRYEFLKATLESRIFGVNLDLTYNSALYRFMEKRARKFTTRGGVLYTLANGVSREHLASGVKYVHEQVSCPVALASLKNSLQGEKNNIELIAERERAIFQAADVVVCPSENVQLYVNGIAPETKTFLLTYPMPDIDLSDVHHADLGGGGGLHAVFVGRIEQAKGLNTLLAAAKAFPQVQFHLVGDLLEGFDNLRNVKLHGRLKRDQVIGVLRSASFLIFPSLSEGSSLVTHEALACGLPGIVSLESGSPYKDKVTGLVVRAEDTDGFIDAISSLVRDPQLLTQLRLNCGNVSPEESRHAYQRSMMELICAL